MNTLYLIGGSPRSGKTTVFNKVIIKKPMVAVSIDALREASRNVLVDESYISIKKLSFEGDVTFHRPGENNKISHTKQFSQNLTEDDLTWKATVGLINHYDRKDIPLVVEGTTITPERIKDLRLKNLQVKVVFVGFTDHSYFETMIAYARNKKDWIYKSIQENNGDDTEIRKWFNDQLLKNSHTAAAAKKYGYKFFSIDNNSFENYCDDVVRYLLDA